MSAKSPFQPQPYAGFLDLPPELRNRIYELVLIHPYQIRIKDGQTPGKRRALLGVCQQIYEEAGPIYYGANVFTYECMESRLTRSDLASTKNLISWLQRIGCRHRSLVKEVYVHMSSPEQPLSLRSTWRFLQDQNARLAKENLLVPLTMLKIRSNFKMPQSDYDGNVDLDIDLIDAEAILREKEIEDLRGHEHHAVWSPEIRRWERCFGGDDEDYEDPYDCKNWCQTCFRRRPYCAECWFHPHDVVERCEFCEDPEESTEE